MKAKIILAFIGGAVAGASISVALMRRKFIEDLERETMILREYYEDKYECITDETEDDEELDDILEETYDKFVEDPKLKFTDYSGISKGKEGLQVYEIVEQVDIDNEMIDDDYLEDIPYIISNADFYNTMVHVDKETYMYYGNEDILTDEYDEVVDDITLVLGGILLMEEDPENFPIYVRNPLNVCDYEIVYDPGSFIDKLMEES